MSSREIGGCIRCNDPNRETSLYAMPAKNREDQRFCDDCARITHAVYELKPAPPKGPDDAAPAPPEAPAPRSRTTT